MSNLLKLIIPSVVCCVVVVFQPLYSAEKVTKHIAQEEVGLSISQPVLIPRVDDIKKINEIQQDYIRNHFPECDLGGEFFLMNLKGDRFIRALVLKNEKGQKKIIYFDVTEAYKKLEKSKNKKVKAEIKELMNFHRPLPMPNGKVKSLI